MWQHLLLLEDVAVRVRGRVRFWSGLELGLGLGFGFWSGFGLGFGLG